MSTTSSKIHLTLVGSQFPGSFIDSLDANPEEFVYTIVSSFAEYAAPVGYPTHVIILNGHDDELAKSTSLATLLDQHIVLAFFAPSKEVLDALHEAADSLISIPNIILEDGAPIVIHRRPNNGVITILPGFSGSTENPTATPEAKLAATFRKSAEIIRLTVKHLLQSLDRGRVQVMVDDELRPPAGTNFWRTITVQMTGTIIPDWHPANETVNQVELYAYCANVKPTESDFAKKGGVIYIVAVLSGYAACEDTYTGVGGDYWLRAIHYSAKSSSLTGVNGEPQAGTPSGSIMIYDMEYTKNLSLWKNNKNTLFTFPVIYKDRFSLDHFKQKVEHEGQGNFIVSIEPFEPKRGVPLDGSQDGELGNYMPNLTNHPLNALFVWTTSSLTSHTIDFTIDYVYKSGGGSSGTGNGTAKCVLDLSKWD